MAAVTRRFSMWILIISVALASAWVGYSLAMGRSMADLRDSIGVDLLGHKDGHKTPPPCGSYGNPPKNPNVAEKNKHC